MNKFTSTKDTNPQDISVNKNENNEESILAHAVPIEDIKSHFDFIFLKEKQSSKNSKYPTRKETAKTLQKIQVHKQNNEKNKKTNNKLLNNSPESTVIKKSE